MDNEIWRSIESLNGKYEVSNYARIRNAKTGKILKQFVSRHGYNVLQVRPTPYHPVNIRVHRIVAEAFLGKCPDGCVVNHKDGNKKNNSVENLEYVSPSENNIHALNAGLRHRATKGNQRRGENHPSAVLTENEVRRILQIHKDRRWGKVKIARQFNISVGAVSAILQNRSWKNIERN